jgi:hypothetical protein
MLPRRTECFAASFKQKMVMRHVLQDDFNQADGSSETPSVKVLYA